METDDTILIRTPEINWTPASNIYSESVMCDDKDIVFVKQLTNRLDNIYEMK